MLKVFELSWSWYEDYCPTLFYGQADMTQAEWVAACRKAVRQAAVIQLDSPGQLMNDGTHYKSWLGMSEFIQGATTILEKMGFEKVEPIKANAFGGYIIKRSDMASNIDHDADGVREWLTPELVERVCKWNEDVERGLRERRRAKGATP